jgi:hypothetical protein
VVSAWRLYLVTEEKSCVCIMGLRELLFGQTCCRNINKEIKTSKYIILQGIATHMLKEFKNYVMSVRCGEQVK